VTSVFDSVFGSLASPAGVGCVATFGPLQYIMF